MKLITKNKFVPVRCAPNIAGKITGRFTASAFAFGLALLGAAEAQVRVGPSVRVDSAPGTGISNEISSATAFGDSLVSIAGYNDYRLGGVRTWFTRTNDGGANWTEFLIRPPVPNQANVEGDPMACFDHRSGSLWAGGIAFSGNGGPYAARYDPATGAFGPTVMIQAAGGTDKGWMAAGPHPTTPGQSMVYCAYNFGVAASADLGDTWSLPVSLGPGIGFLPRVSADGTVHVAYYDFADHILRSSSDGGATWSPPVTIATRLDNWPIQDCPRIPGDFRVPALQGLAVHPTDPDRLYSVYADTSAIVGLESDVDVYFTRSVDAGATWSVPVVINGDVPFEGDQWFPWIEVDEEARLHVTWYDSRHVSQLDAEFNCRFDGYYSLSLDDGATWEEARLTSTPFESVDDGFNSGFIGDYIGMSVAGSRALPYYMKTDPASQADAHTNVILVDQAQEYCHGIACPCGNEDPLRGCGNAGADNDFSTGSSLSASGSPSIVADDLVMTIDGVTPGQFGVLVVGDDSGSSLVGDGRLCLGGTLIRYQAFQTNGSGVGTVGPNTVISYVSVGPLGTPTVGQTWYFQMAYRDQTGPCGALFNFTNALSVTWEM